MKNKKSIFFIIVSVPFFILMVFTSIQIVSNSDLFFKKYFEESNIYDKRGVSAEDATYVIDILVDYMEGKTKEIKLDRSVLGFTEFSERESLHMVDVRNIYSFFKTLRNISCILYVGMLIYFVKKNRDEKLFKKSLISFIVSIFTFLGAIIYIVLNFNEFWLLFHKVIFTNDLWALSFQNDLMINVCSNEMFKILILSSFVIYIVLSIIWLSLLYIYEKKQSVNKKYLTDVSG